MELDFEIDKITESIENAETVFLKRRQNYDMVRYQRRSRL